MFIFIETTALYKYSHFYRNIVVRSGRYQRTVGGPRIYAAAKSHFQVGKFKIECILISTLSYKFLAMATKLHSNVNEVNSCFKQKFLTLNHV